MFWAGDPAWRSPSRVYDAAQRRFDKVTAMGKIEHIEQQVASLAPDELATFRAWFAEFDADSWEKQIAADAQAGRLDALADAALEEDRKGRTRPL